MGLKLYSGRGVAKVDASGGFICGVMIGRLCIRGNKFLTSTLLCGEARHF